MCLNLTVIFTNDEFGKNRAIEVTCVIRSTDHNRDTECKGGVWPTVCASFQLALSGFVWSGDRW